MIQLTKRNPLDMAFLVSAILCGATGTLTWIHIAGLTDTSAWEMIAGVASPLNLVFGIVMFGCAGLHMLRNHGSANHAERRYTHGRNE